MVPNFYLKPNIVKYKLEINIDLPQEKIIDLFDNSDNMKHWQNGFISFEHLSENPVTNFE